MSRKSDFLQIYLFRFDKYKIFMYVYIGSSVDRQLRIETLHILRDKLVSPFQPLYL